MLSVLARTGVGYRSLVEGTKDTHRDEGGQENEAGPQDYGETRWFREREGGKDHQTRRVDHGELVNHLHWIYVCYVSSVLEHEQGGRRAHSIVKSLHFNDVWKAVDPRPTIT